MCVILNIIIYFWMNNMLNIKKAFPVHKFSSNTYIIDSGGEVAVIDPSVPYDSSLFEGRLKYILLTHSHFDHILDIDSWVNAGGEVIVSEFERDFLPDPKKNCYALFFAENKGYHGDATCVSDGDTLALGDEVIEVISVPGHTCGSLVYRVGKIGFVGDTVFAGGGYGRFDLPSGNVSELLRSIQQICSFPDDTVLYPGHGEATTVKEFKDDFNR